MFHGKKPDLSRENPEGAAVWRLKPSLNIEAFRSAGKGLVIMDRSSPKPDRRKTDWDNHFVLIVSTEYTEC